MESKVSHVTGKERLPRTIVPVHYHVSLIPNAAIFTYPPPIAAADRTFTGTTAVVLHLQPGTAPVNELVFHSLELEFKASDVQLYA
jgi:hypothetical protein